MLLKQEDIQRMAYQIHGGVVYSYGNEEKLRKKLNRKIIRNYILFTLLGAVVTAQAFLSAKNPAIMKKILLADALIVFGASVAYTISPVIKYLIEEKKQEKIVI